MEKVSLERLDKFLTNQNICSRKEAGALARKGAVTVNGKTVAKADVKIDPQMDVVQVCGNPVVYNRFLYLMMNKPEGVLSATEDNKGKTVLDLVPEQWRRRGLAPAGRLDKNTTGLLILTDDGEFTHRMLAPKSHVYKVYEAGLDGDVTAEDIRAFEAGITTKTAEFLPASLWLPDPENPRKAMVRIREGKFHQVKRMFAFCGKQVVSLKRIRIGDLLLDDELAPGCCRMLNQDEIRRIFSGNMYEKEGSNLVHRKNI